MGFAIRTVRNGAIKINGHILKPIGDDYKGELERKRFVFGTYDIINREQGVFVSLWGTEEMFRFQGDRNSAEFDEVCSRNESVINGVLRWQWWADDKNIAWVNRERKE